MKVLTKSLMVVAVLFMVATPTMADVILVSPVFRQKGYVCTLLNVSKKSYSVTIGQWNQAGQCIEFPSIVGPGQWHRISDFPGFATTTYCKFTVIGGGKNDVLATVNVLDPVDEHTVVAIPVNTVIPATD